MQTGKLEGLGKRAGMGDTDEGGIRCNTVFQRVWDLSPKFEQRSGLSEPLGWGEGNCGNLILRGWCGGC